jgi:hypothetical protein
MRINPSKHSARYEVLKNVTSCGWRGGGVLIATLATPVCQAYRTSSAPAPESDLSKIAEFLTGEVLSGIALVLLLLGISALLFWLGSLAVIGVPRPSSHQYGRWIGSIAASIAIPVGAIAAGPSGLDTALWGAFIGGGLGYAFGFLAGFAVVLLRLKP